MKSLFTALLLAFIFTGSLHAQQLRSTEDSALVEVIVKDFHDKLRVHDRILFEGQKTHSSFSGITDDSGRFRLLLPEGDTYNIVVKGLGENQEYSTFSIPKTPGTYALATLTVKYEPAKTFTLKNLQFESGKASIRKGSESILDELAELMRLKPAMTIEVAGHTDDIGNDADNLLLSQNRAEAVKTYLVQKGGIGSSRIRAKGYGETQPIADNGTEDARQANRRTEVKILSE